MYQVQKKALIGGFKTLISGNRNYEACEDLLSMQDTENVKLQ